MELKNKRKSLTHKLHCEEKQITKQLAQTPTTFGLTKALQNCKSQGSESKAEITVQALLC